MDFKSKRKRPLEEGLWITDTDGSNPRLLGNRCPSCGELYFPRVKCKVCLNCRSSHLEDRELSTHGTIRSVSVVMIPPAGGFYKGPIPYAYGLVDLPEGIMIKSIIYSTDLSQLKAGDSVELIIQSLHIDDDGNDVMTYMFKPIND